MRRGRATITAGQHLARARPRRIEQHEVVGSAGPVLAHRGGCSKIGYMEVGVVDAIAARIRPGPRDQRRRRPRRR